MVVKNLNRASLSPCRCGGWLTHWLRYGKPSQSFIQRQECAVVMCRNPFEVGGHVQKEVLEGRRVPGLVGDASWYVVPLCESCHQRSGAFLTIEDDCGLAPVHTRETCGREETG